MTSAVSHLGESQGNSENLGARLLGIWSGGSVLVTQSFSGTPELIFELGPNGSGIPDVVNVNPSGLSLRVVKVRISGKDTNCVVITPTHEKFFQAFEVLSEFLYKEFVGDPAYDGTLAELEIAISRWMDFLQRRRGTSQKESIQGMVGELLCLQKVIDTSQMNFDMWLGPSGAPQDFRIGSTWIEVKTSQARKGPIVHKISSIDQLEVPKDGRLLVVSFRLVLSKSGQHSVHELVASVRDMELNQKPGATIFFDKNIAACGYSEELPLEYSTFDIFETCIYEVRDGFPRLSRADIPDDHRILDLAYSVDFSAASEYLLPFSSGEKLVP
jgi:hypothetical protein